MKKSPLRKAKDKAWSVFSKYIRFKYADKDGYCQCVTCGVIKHWKEIHAGHFIDGRNNSVLFDERLVHPQCFHCNSKRPGCLNGNKVAYTLFMLKKGHTSSDIAVFEGLKHKVKKMRIADFKDIEDKYLDKLTGLEIARKDGTS